MKLRSVRPDHTTDLYDQMIEEYRTRCVLRFVLLILTAGFWAGAVIGLIFIVD